MKEVYICEKCGFQSDNYDEVYQCESSHITGYYNFLDPEYNSFVPAQTFKKGDLFSRSIWVQAFAYNKETQKSEAIVARYELIDIDKNMTAKYIEGQS